MDLSIISEMVVHPVIKVGLHGLHFSWLIPIYIINNQ